MQFQPHMDYFSLSITPLSSQTFLNKQKPWQLDQNTINKDKIKKQILYHLQYIHPTDLLLNPYKLPSGLPPYQATVTKSSWMQRSYNKYLIYSSYWINPQQYLSHQAIHHPDWESKLKTRFCTRNPNLLSPSPPLFKLQLHLTRFTGELFIIWENLFIIHQLVSLEIFTHPCFKG